MQKYISLLILSLIGLKFNDPTSIINSEFHDGTVDLGESDEICPNNNSKTVTKSQYLLETDFLLQTLSPLDGDQAKKSPEIMENTTTSSTVTNFGIMGLIASSNDSCEHFSVFSIISTKRMKNIFEKANR